ncbi:MAG4530 family protein [Mycoplasma miroungigenitalium]
MLLKDKINFLKQKNWIKNSLKRYYLFLFLSTLLFSVILYIFVLVSTSNFELFNILKNKNKGQDIAFKTYVYLYILLIVLLFLQVIWFLNSLSIIYINKYYEYNWFRAYKWLKLKLFVTLNIRVLKQMTTKNEQKDDVERNIIFRMQKNGFVLHGSKSLELKYKDYFRKANDLDFISYEKNCKLNNIGNLKTIYNDGLFAKYSYDNKPVEIFLPKFIQKNKIWNKNGFFLPKRHFLISMKIHQLFKSFMLSKKNLDKSDEKVENALMDLAFLISKSNILSIKKIISHIEYMYFSNFFVSYFMKSDAFVPTKDNINSFLIYINSKLNLNGHLFELNELFNLIFKKMNLKKFNLISKKINEIIKDKYKFEQEILNISTHKDKTICSLKRVFSSDNEYNILMSRFKEIDYKNLSGVLNSLIDEFKGIQNENNGSISIDIRELLLLELAKRLRKENYE